MYIIIVKKCRRSIEDGLTFLYFNTGGTRGGNEAIRALLTYLQDSRKENVVDEATDRLHKLITKVKEKPEVRLEYMKFEDIIYWNYVLFYSFDGKKELFVDDPDDHFVFVFYAIYDR